MKFVSFFPKKLCTVIPIRGGIDHKLDWKVGECLKKVKKSRTSVLAAVVNSRGGSPAFSHHIYMKIKNFADSNGIKLLTFAEDVAASGGYYILTAGHEVFAQEASLVGSIGVISAKLDLTKAAQMNKIDVKQFASSPGLIQETMSPFHVQTPEERANYEKILSETHDNFINHIESTRTSKFLGESMSTLELRRENLYTGDVWTGLRAKEIGLVDHIGSYHKILAERYPDHEVAEIRNPTSWMKKLVGINSVVDIITK